MSIIQKNLNPLFDLDFLNKLLENNSRTLFVRITSLDINEQPIEFIEGRATAGSINVDGNSAVRRTCSVTLVAQELNITDFYWGLKTKFKLEIGVSNAINGFYPDIIWFKQGIYVITSFSTSQNTGNYTVNISGKDKMCLLNGDLGGALPHTTDFGIEEYYDSTTGITTYTPIPIKTIVREAVQNFGNELAQNIIINDIEDAGLELLEYRGDITLYLLREIESDTFSNMTINANQPCYIEGKGEAIIISKIPIYDNLVELEGSLEPTIISLVKGDEGKKYTVAKIEYGNIPGYRLTDLTYAGDLILNVGETVAALLDKIKTMLGSYEYFYNLDGKFVFQRQKIYASIPWLNSEKGDELPVEDSTPMWSFLNNQLITAISNTPNLSNLRNDFAVWGKKKTAAGSELDLHMRYAIDRKPEKYHSLIEDKDYTAEEWDWRELIYQMALDYRKFYHDDDFLYRLAQANPQYPGGRTGYEQYYVDMEGFWRTIYSPESGLEYEEIDEADVSNYNTKDEIYIKQAYREATAKEREELAYTDFYVLEDNEMRSFAKSKRCFLAANETYYYFDSSGNLNPITYDGSSSSVMKLMNGIYIENFYTSGDKNNREKVVEKRLKEALAAEVVLYTRDKDISYTKYQDLNKILQSLYSVGVQYRTALVYTKFDNFGNEKEKLSNDVYYYNGYYTFDPETHWSREVQNAPEKILFWFDFLDADMSELGKYAVSTVGIRSKALKDDNVKSVYYREVPKVIFQTGEETYEHQTGYTYVQLQDTMENLFTISSKGKSAKERIEELLQTHGYCTESANITTIPVYHLEPNSRIYIQNDNSNIFGEYVVNKITIPLAYNGTMSITATKAISDLL